MRVIERIEDLAPFHGCSLVPTMGALHEGHASLMRRATGDGVPVLATVFVKDGKVYAEAIGLKDKLDTITVQRANNTNILFRNLDEKEHRMVIHLGEAKVGDTGTVEKVET